MVISGLGSSGEIHSAKRFALRAAERPSAITSQQLHIEIKKGRNAHGNGILERPVY
jgi:hypothetical protein